MSRPVTDFVPVNGSRANITLMLYILFNNETRNDIVHDIETSKSAYYDYNKCSLCKKICIGLWILNKITDIHYFHISIQTIIIIIKKSHLIIIWCPGMVIFKSGSPIYTWDTERGDSFLNVLAWKPPLLRKGFLWTTASIPWHLTLHSPQYR